MPTLTDPKEYALIKKIYFNNDDDVLNFNQIDSLEKLERQESRQRNKYKTSR